MRGYEEDRGETMGFAFLSVKLGLVFALFFN